MGRPWSLNQNSYKLRTPGMELWTDGAPLIFKSELLRNFVLRGWSLRLMEAPLIFESDLLQTSYCRDGALD